MAPVADPLEPPTGPTLSHPDAREDALSETQSLKAAVAQAGEESGLAAQSANGSPTGTTPSVIRRKLNGFVGFSNLPQQGHQRTGREGFTLNLILVGESGLGKSTLLNTLFEMPLHPLQPQQTVPPPGGSAHAGNTSGNNGHGEGESRAAGEGNESNGSLPSDDPSRTVHVSASSVDIEENGVRLHLTVIDTPGFGDHINNLDSWKPIVDEIDGRFESYLDAENSVNRTTIPDTRVHACLYFIQPTGHSLKPLDVVVMKKLHKKVNLIPIIAKADTLTADELATFKQLVLNDIRHQGIEIFSPPTYEDDEPESAAETRELTNRIPFAVVGSTQIVQTADGRQVFGRAYPWGVIEVNNEDHSDFVKLRSLLIRDHLEDLKERTSSLLYESFRSEKLFERGVQQDSSVFREIDLASRQEEEREYHAQRLERMEKEMRQVFDTKVTEKEAKLKKSENDLFAKHREIKEQLDRQRLELEAKKAKLEQSLPPADEKKRKGFSLRP